jgi:hypothetical protein
MEVILENSLEQQKEENYIVLNFEETFENILSLYTKCISD